jgi:OFA family oxalate/formate antiporter-like MFS transporter
MPEKSGGAIILISCACAIFWPGAFIFGFPGIMRQHWQQAFNAGSSAIGQTVFFVLTGTTCFMYLCGRWQEKYGPGKLAAIGAVLCGGSVIWLGRAEEHDCCLCLGIFGRCLISICLCPGTDGGAALVS